MKRDKSNTHQIKQNAQEAAAVPALKISGGDSSMQLIADHRDSSLAQLVLDRRPANGGTIQLQGWLIGDSSWPGGKIDQTADPLKAKEEANRVQRWIQGFTQEDGQTTRDSIPLIEALLTELQNLLNLQTDANAQRDVQFAIHDTNTLLRTAKKKIKRVDEKRIGEEFVEEMDDEHIAAAIGFKNKSKQSEDEPPAEVEDDW